MRASFVAVSLLLGLPAGAVAHKDWLKTFGECWRDCLDKTGDGCDDSDCICSASQDNSFLPAATSCMVSNCDGDDWTVQFAFLAPMAMYCAAVGESIPDEVLSSASAACESTTSAVPFTTRQVQHSQKSADKTKGGDDLTSTITSTVTKTTTDNDGHTLQIVVPVVVGPDTVSYGKPTTSTVDAKSTSSNAPSSGAASPSQTADTPAATSAPPQQGQAESSTTSSEAPKRTSNSNGSPFENMQAGAERHGLSGMLVGLGAVAGLFMRL